VENLAERLATMPGVVAVTLGGPWARAVEGSDWDFGLYYRGGADSENYIVAGATRAHGG
jgi:hypothetical protein